MSIREILRPRLKAVDGWDLNILGQEEQYNGIWTLGGNYGNSPVNYGVLFTVHTKYAYHMQIVIGANNKLYTRFGEGNSWKAWREF